MTEPSPGRDGVKRVGEEEGRGERVVCFRRHGGHRRALIGARDFQRFSCRRREFVPPYRPAVAGFFILSRRRHPPQIFIRRVVTVTLYYYAAAARSPDVVVVSPGAII